MSSNNKYSGGKADREKKELDVRRKLMATDKKEKEKAPKDKGGGKKK